MRKMPETTVMIHVQMSEDDPFHIARADAQRVQLRTYLFFAIDSKRDLPSDKGMKRLPGFDQMRTLASIDHNDTFLMINDPSVRG